MLKSHFVSLLRRIRRAPLPAVMTLATIAIGVGATTAVFSVVDGILLKPLSYPHPGRLVSVAFHAPGVGVDRLNCSRSAYVILREQDRTFQDIGLYNNIAVSITGTAQPEHVQALRVTDGLLPLLGVQAQLGRLFTRKDDSPGSPETVLLSDAYGHRKFGGDPSIIGRGITIDNKPYQIIGVLPNDFHFLDQQTPNLILPFKSIAISSSSATSWIMRLRASKLELPPRKPVWMSLA